METFKQLVIVKQIGGAIMDGRAISNTWGFPDFVLNNEEVLSNFFGEEVYAVYSEMTSEERQAAISWYEISGGVINEMAKTAPWEEDSESFRIDIVAFSQAYPDLFKGVVLFVCDKAYSSFPEDVQQIIIEKFTNEPEEFQNEMNRNRG